ncbi:MAG: acetamidase [Planctomycetota bacterium]|nr:MAG: acetamidase [Planctomycetota bacterium]
MAHHTFTPTAYHNTIGWQEPVAWVESGDTITTTTVDARGFDIHWQPIAPRGNPMTGPFAVRGLEPGESLLVKILSLTPTRDRGFTTASVAPHCVDPDYVRELPPNDLIYWQIDTDTRTVQLIPPEGVTMPPLVVPLDPMLGCFGVAPARSQFLSTATSGDYGGNMDYRRCRMGAAILFPVHAPGGRFFLGDGHAVQGDGEISGNGVEVPMQVTFQLQRIAGVSIRWPRLIDAEGIATIGNARPLDQATQHATTEMLRCLITEGGLVPAAAHLWLQQTVRYEVGNVFDPAYTMACQLPRAAWPDSLTDSQMIRAVLASQ